jgi:hypothetical protein
VDTGERHQFFGYQARHVITTRKQTRLDESVVAAEPDVWVTDGWYIDLDRRISCEPKREAGGRAGFITSSASIGGKATPMERPEFVNIGTPETGLPVKETRTSPMATTSPDGTRSKMDHTEELEVTVLEKTAIDTMLFEVPVEYKEIENRHNASEFN